MDGFASYPSPPRKERGTTVSSYSSTLFCPLSSCSHIFFCIGTGAISILFAAFPYGYDTRVMNILSLVFFFLNLFLVVLFTALTLARYHLYPHIWALTLQNPAASLYIGCFPMGIATLINPAVDVINTRYDFGGKGFLYLVWAVWWADVVISVLCCWGLVHIMSVDP
jgi:tellurite resistance protein TehA-like permease